MMDAWLGELGERIIAAGKSQSPLCIRGGGSKRFYGGAEHGDLIRTTDYHGVLDYDPAELVMTARAGTPLAEIEALLEAHHQCLPFEPPYFSRTATLGGCIASGLAGPARFVTGAVSDFVLGATLMDGQGRVLRFGGQVMKNVAGYDVARLLAGSMGILGIILDLSVKVLPRPRSQLSLRMQIDQGSAMVKLNRWLGEGLPLSGSVWNAGTLTLRLSGAEASVGKARQRLGGEALDHQTAQAFWCSVREQGHAFFDSNNNGDRTLWRCCLPATTPPIGAQDVLIEWAGAQRWLWSENDDVRAAARQAGGHAVAFRQRAPRHTVFDALDAPTQALHERVKAVFDPHGIFNRGRMFGAF